MERRNYFSRRDAIGRRVEMPRITITGVTLENVDYIASDLLSHEEKLWFKASAEPGRSYTIEQTN